MIRLEEIEKIPLIDTHMHRVHPARAPEWGSLGGGYIPGRARSATAGRRFCTA
ncbi:hypothetical protein [Gemmiger formicilis]|uniref:hypothetical protein n=1 Tax=Gemmiger formicilis TaxID=745368 RepID=UPI00399B6FD9